MDFSTENTFDFDFPIEKIYFCFDVWVLVFFQPGFSIDKAYMRADICPGLGIGILELKTD